MDIQIINPVEYEDWDNLILSHPDYSFFHSSAWLVRYFQNLTSTLPSTLRC